MSALSLHIESTDSMTRIKNIKNIKNVHPHPTYLSTSKICRVELCTELFYAIIPTLFLCFLLICYPTSCYIFKVFILVHVTFFSSRCMLELKFTIYYRAASLPSQASYAVLSEESQAFFKHSCTPTVFLIQQSCIIITFRC